MSSNLDKNQRSRDPTSDGPLLALRKSHVRPYNPSDTPTLAQVANNPSIPRFLRNIFPSPYTLSDAECWIQHCSTLNPLTQFALTEPTTNVVIGGIGLTQQEDVHSRSWELGYWLGEEFWGRGIMAEAARAIVDWGFQNLVCERIFAGLFSENKASERVIKKAGFTYEGRLRCAVWKYGRSMDVLMYSIVRQDWECERDKETEEAMGRMES
ncbi:acyl-CoA N-acyltransferase [Periconia macrospinosa]|uniref:Acyl-CoA N-acyltransferase n=1 Tax=Periconia macrospinosa TaxID=97972 RepID=A0A2V1DMB0_9PLEO|nr:acyl-CoA N-acyltransferase [Periconia macrospinosa]